MGNQMKIAPLSRIALSISLPTLLGTACFAPQDDADSSPFSSSSPPSAASSGPTSDGTTGMDSNTTTTSSPSTGTDDDIGSTSENDSTDDGFIFDLGSPDDPDPVEPPTPSLWYAVSNMLVHIELDPAHGASAQANVHTITNDPPLLFDDTVFSAITMLDDGSLLGARTTDEPADAQRTQLYHIPVLPTGGQTVQAVILGDLPNQIMIEALYTDCDGNVYLMDSGVDLGSSEGNRLLRFTGDFLNLDFSYAIITDLTNAMLEDIDDMSPGIDGNGDITDNPGLAIDTSNVYALDFTDNMGNGDFQGTAGTFGIHALGGALFDDGVSRLYVMDDDARLYLVTNLEDLTLSDPLVTGPPVPGAPRRGMTGITGPLTDCVSAFPPPA